jgi:hypothetical protein
VFPAQSPYRRFGAGALCGRNLPLLTVASGTTVVRKPPFAGMIPGPNHRASLVISLL